MGINCADDIRALSKAIRRRKRLAHKKKVKQTNMQTYK